MENQVNNQVNDQMNEPINNQANIPMNSQPNYQMNNQQNYPMNNQGNYPMNNQGYPVNNQGNYPVNNQGYPMNNQGNYPMNNQGYPMNNQGNYPMNNQMGYQMPKPAQKSSMKTIILSAVTAFLALMMTVSWFLPVVAEGGRSQTILGSLSLLNVVEANDDPTIGFWTIIVMCASVIVWSVIPKKWSAIVGVVFAGIMASLSGSQIYQWATDGRKLAVGAILMIIFSALTCIAAVIRLIFVIMDRKQNR